MTKRQLMLEIEKLIQRQELIVWIHGEKVDFLPGAVNVCMNGPSLQIEVDPKWKFREA